MKPVQSDNDARETALVQSCCIKFRVERFSRCSSLFSITSFVPGARARSMQYSVPAGNDELIAWPQNVQVSDSWSHVVDCRNGRP